jgi:MFS family permease
LFYSGVFPFIKYATDLMINKFHVVEEYAGLIPGMLTVGAIALTPLFGNLYDRKGKGASIMMIGAVLLLLVHTLFSIPVLSAKPIAIILIIILGIAFSLVPSAMWPSVPKIIPERQLGTAYGMIFLIQNIGLSLVPLLIGWVLDKFCITGTRMLEGSEVPTYNYTLPMIIFACFGLLAIVFAFLLKAEDKKKGYGLELPNIKN